MRSCCWLAPDLPLTQEVVGHVEKILQSIIDTNY